MKRLPFMPGDVCRFRADDPDNRRYVNDYGIPWVFTVTAASHHTVYWGIDWNQGAPVFRIELADGPW